jgi:hypothetical protein
MNWNVVFAPLLPVPLLIGLCAAGLLLVLATIFFRARGWPLRAVSFLLLAAALFNPSLHSEDREYLPDIAVAVIDRSQSQDIGERAAQTAEAEAALRRAVQNLGNVELRVVGATSGFVARDDGTRLFEALDRALADIPPERYAGAIFVTDGQVHDVPADLAKTGINGPLHALITGERGEKDRRIVLEQSPRFGIVGRDQILKFRVDEHGGGGGPVSVSIKIGDSEPQAVEVLPGQMVEVPFTIDRGGQNIVEIAAAPMEGEITLQNNRVMSVTEGIRERLRVLLVSGEPHPGERTWRNLLKADASVDLVHFTILRPPEKQDGTPIKELSLIAFPTRELFVEKLDEFDLVIFDRYQRQGVLPLAYLANVADYVDRGGAVLIAAGPDFAEPEGLYNTPLGSVLSTQPSGNVIEGAFRPRLTQKGRRHPVTAGLPGSGAEEPTWGRWFRLIEADPGDGETIMAGIEDRPLLVLARKGEGRVAQLLSDHGWLWARGYDGGGPQTELLRRLAHWLMKEPDLEEEALRGRQDNRQLVVERRTMADAAKPVTVTTPSGKTETLNLLEEAPGLWTARLAVSEAGLFRLNDDDLTSIAVIGNADPKETADVVATEEKLAPAVKALGGGIAWLADRGGIPRVVKADPGRQMAGSGWIGLRENGAYRVRGLQDIPLFATLLALAALLLLLSGMWYREGR